MKRYYAVFKKTPEATEVFFPDLEGCATFDDHWSEALENAIDVLIAWLANAEASFVREPSSNHELAKKLKCHEGLVPISVDENIRAL